MQVPYYRQNVYSSLSYAIRVGRLNDCVNCFPNTLPNQSSSAHIKAYNVRLIIFNVIPKQNT